MAPPAFRSEAVRQHSMSRAFTGPNRIEKAMATQEQEISTSMPARQEPITTASTQAQQDSAAAVMKWRGEDALMRAATEVAAPRRRLLASLRDAHADTAARIAGLRRACRPPAASPRAGDAHPVLARLLEEAEEQLHRLETVLALLRERPAANVARLTAAEAALPAGEAGGHAPALLRALAAEERRGAEEARRMRDLAHLAGQHMAARLLDLTAGEREASARDIAAASGHH
jgi:hypothetical protein